MRCSTSLETYFILPLLPLSDVFLTLSIYLTPPGPSSHILSWADFVLPQFSYLQ